MSNFRERETPQTAVENLAIAMGMMFGNACLFPSEAVDCYIESVVVLGKAAGLTLEDFNAFDVTRNRVKAACEKYA